MLKKLANLITDVRVVVGGIIIVLGFVFMASGIWHTLTGRVTASEEDIEQLKNSQAQITQVNESILMQLNALKEDQAVIKANIDNLGTDNDKLETKINQIINILVGLSKI